MIGQDQQIIYVAEGDAVVYFKMQEQRQVGNSGFTTKKIVITTKRLLLFQSLGNKLQETEYQLTTTIAKKEVKGSKIEQDMERKIRISVNGLPEIDIDVLGIEPKVIIEEQPALYRFLQKQNIQNIVKNLAGLAILKITKKMQYYLIHMGTIPNAIKLSKAVICAQSWKRYRVFCKERRVEQNPRWVRIVTEVIYNDDSVILIDPDLFITGSKEQIQSFVFLISLIPFAHCYHHRFNITTPEAASYSGDFINPIQKKVHYLSLKQTNLDASNLKIVLSKATMPNLLKLDLSSNMLNDQVFQALARTIKAGSKRLAYINLSKNQIKLGNPQLLVELLKSLGSILNLDISRNFIDDSSTETFEKYVIFAMNPPLQELNISFNKFSRKTAWRLFVGNLRNFRNHPYLKFILYPIPIKRQIFSEFDVDFPRHNTTINLNMHSALAEEFQQQSFLRHTFEDVPATSAEMLTINFRRVTASNVKLPTNRQELNKTLQISNKVQNFIYSPQAVQRIYNMALELKRFPFQVPPISKAHFIKYLYQKFNEALFIRDHYSVKYLLKALIQLQASVQGYIDRLNKVKQRDSVYAKRTQNILNFEIDENKINEELDELVREGLRLYLQGHGVQIVYYLKYRRDQYIERYLQEKLNPEHLLFDLMAKKNISAQQNISEKEFIIPYQIRLEKKINQHFYLHPWQANYQVLAQMKTGVFEACLQFLQESEKKQKFALYFDRIQQRIEFIKNEFAYFSFNKFKASYSDLKINACRLLYLYNNIKETTLYLQLPIYVKKRQVTPEKNLVILNKEWFRKEYHIVNYLNINLKARKANFYNYQGILCRYQSDLFHNQAAKILPTINDMLKKIQGAIATRSSFALTIPKILQHIKYIIDTVRHSLVPQQLKEQLYLHLVGWRKGRYGSNSEVLQLIPAFTMYLKPPIHLQKFLAAALLQNQTLQQTEMPLCLATNPNQATTQNVLILENQFVQRDWVPSDKIYCQIFEKKGKVNFEVQTLEKTNITILVAQSRTVSELMSILAQTVQMVVDDKQHFWLYKYSKETQEIIPYQSREHLGQILADYDSKQHILLLKRRIYSRQLKFNFSKYGQSMINSLYHDVKYEYLCRNFFVNDKLSIEIASMFFMIENAQNILLEATNKKSLHIKHALDQMTMDRMLIEKQKQLDSTFLSYIPQKTYKRLSKPKETLIAQLKAKISQRLLKGQYINIFQMKLNFLKIVSSFPEFVSTNYVVRSKDLSEMRLSLNSMYIYVENQMQSEYIHLQKLVAIHLKSKYILIYYHKQQNLVTQLPVFADEKILFALAMDMLSYCSVRIKMSSINLYQIYHLQELTTKISSYQKSLRRVYDKAVQKDLSKYRQDLESSLKKIGKMSLSLMHFKELPYYNKNHYIKTEINRKLYANKSEKKLQFQKQIDEQQLNEINLANKKILQMIFPQFHMKVNEMDENQPEEQEIKQIKNNKNNQSNESFDYKKQYERLNFQTTQKKEQPKKSQLEVPKKQERNQNPPQLSPIRPLQDIEEKQGDVVTGRKGGRNLGKKGRR